MNVCECVSVFMCISVYVCMCVYVCVWVYVCDMSFPYLSLRITDTECSSTVLDQGRVSHLIRAK